MPLLSKTKTGPEIAWQFSLHYPASNDAEIAEKHYIQRELCLLHLWHVKIEAWILEQAGIEFVPMQANWRVVFKFDGADVELVDYLDYH